jgi:hypothetical protein
MRCLTRLCSRLVCGLLPLITAACWFWSPYDLRVESVFRADWTNIPTYRRNVEEGFIEPIGLVVELATNEPYLYFTSVPSAFCGEHKDPLNFRGVVLYEMPASQPISLTAPGSGPNDVPQLHHYFVLIDIRGRRILSLPNLPDYDLAHDNRDICLKTHYSHGFDSVDSNEVCIPRSMIDQALREPPRILPRLVGTGP